LLHVNLIDKHCRASAVLKVQNPPEPSLPERTTLLRDPIRGLASPSGLRRPKKARAGISAEGWQLLAERCAAGAPRCLSGSRSPAIRRDRSREEWVGDNLGTQVPQRLGDFAASRPGSNSARRPSRERLHFAYHSPRM
jgi:hypothetical protein